MPIVSLTKKDSMQYTVYYSKLAFYSVHSLKHGERFDEFFD